jgi:hypothetical protein
MNKQTKILALLSAGAIASYLIFRKNKKVNATGCPSGMQLYYGTCIPTKNEYAACPQGYMKETVGGACVKIPDSTSIGGCGAGEDYRMGFRIGDMTPTMGCYPIGANIDINMGSSTGYILGGGAGSNIGGGGTVQGGSGNYSDTSESRYGGGQLRTNVTCNENQVYDPKSGFCVNKELNPIFIKQDEPIITPIITQEEEVLVTCPDNYTLTNGMCYPTIMPNTIVQPKIKATKNNNILYIIGGALLLTTLVLTTNKNK